MTLNGPWPRAIQAIGFSVRDNENRRLRICVTSRGEAPQRLWRHGLCMLAIDDLVGSTKEVETLVDPILSVLLNGTESHPTMARANI